MAIRVLIERKIVPENQPVLSSLLMRLRSNLLTSSTTRFGIRDFKFIGVGFIVCPNTDGAIVIIKIKMVILNLIFNFNS